MAINSVINSTNFSIVFKAGITEDGKDILKTASWKCNPSASNEDIFNLGSALSVLYPFGIFDVLKEVNSSLVEE